MFGRRKKTEETPVHTNADRNPVFSRLFPQGYPDEAATGEFRERPSDESAAPGEEERIHFQELPGEEASSISMVRRKGRKRKVKRERVAPGTPMGARRDETLWRESRWWHLAPVLLFVVGAALVFWSQFEVGYAWDESFYYEPALQAGEWVVRLAAGETGMMGAEQVERFWSERSEHPSFHKLLAGLSLLYLEDLAGIDPLAAMRIPSALLYGLTLALIFLLGRRTWSAPAGLIAALAYLAMPRIFGHANFSSLETPLLFATLLVVYCFVRGLISPWWAALTGAALGLLVATKINGFFLIPPLILWGHLFARRHYVNNLFSMVVIGPIVWVLLWPWLWHDTPMRILEYLAFHVTHQQTALWFLGQKWGYGAENAPWFYPSVMIGVTLPLSVLLLAALGLLASLVLSFRRPLPILYLLIALTMWAVASAPGTPRYDGVRLFLPVFPFLALFAGAGAELLIAAGRLSARRGGSARAPGLIAAVLAVAIVIEGGWAIAAMRPYYLSYFNPAVGGLEGARELGFETTYWGEAVTDEVIQTLNREIPDGASLKVLALHELNFQHLQRWGELKESIRIGGPPPYDYHLLLHRRGFFTRPERALADFPHFPPVAAWGEDDVTLLSLHRTGPAFERFWPTLPMDPPVTMPRAQPPGPPPAVEAEPAPPDDAPPGPEETEPAPVEVVEPEPAEAPTAEPVEPTPVEITPAESPEPAAEPELIRPEDAGAEPAQEGAEVEVGPVRIIEPEPAEADEATSPSAEAEARAAEATDEPTTESTGQPGVVTRSRETVRSLLRAAGDALLEPRSGEDSATTGAETTE